jgi:two-component system response regulator FixJ
MPLSRAIHVVDDERDTGRSLAMLLANRGFDVTFHDDPRHLLKVPGGELGCVISDIAMPGMNGLQLMQAVREAGNQVPFLFVTGHGSVSMAVKAMKLGAVDCLVKPFALRDLLAALDAVLADPSPPEGAIGRLSKREAEVLSGLLEGETNKQIARTLGLSPRTVEAYRAHVMQKMHATNLPQLVRASILSGVAD